jgi:hypothetical protein
LTGNDETQLINESDELSRVLVSIDGVLHGRGSNDYVDQITGARTRNGTKTTGWQFFESKLGVLGPGEHTLIIGGYNNKKTDQNESTEIFINNVVLNTGASNNFSTPPLSVAAANPTSQW